MKETTIMREISQIIGVKEEDILRTLERFKREIKESETRK